jgi:hypothetical protein
MKQTSIVFEKLLNSKKKVMHKEEIVECIKGYNKAFGHSLSVKDSIKYLSRQNYIKRIFLKYYYINSFDERKRKICFYEDKELLFLVLNELKIKWYVGLNSALYDFGETWQLPNNISILNTKFSGSKKIVGLNVKFYKIKNNLIFGLKKAKTKNNITYSYSIPAKTYLDIVYLRVSKKLVRTKETKKYLGAYPKWVGMK